MSEYATNDTSHGSPRMSSAPGSRLPSTQPVNLRVFAVALLVLLALLLSGRELAGPRSASAAPQQGKSPIVAAQIPGQQGSPTSIPASNASVVPGTVSVALES